MTVFIVGDKGGLEIDSSCLDSNWLLVAWVYLGDFTVVGVDSESITSRSSSKMLGYCLASIRDA